jgi:hypothetical protein
MGGPQIELNGLFTGQSASSSVMTGTAGTCFAYGQGQIEIRVEARVVAPVAAPIIRTDV